MSQIPQDEKQPKMTMAATDKNIKYQTHYRNHPQKVGQDQFPPSATIPGQALTVAQLRDRFGRGLGATGVKAPVYLDQEMDSDEFNRLDLAEQQNIMETNRLLIQEMEQDLKGKRKIYEQRKRDEAIEQAVEKREKERLRDLGYTSAEIRDAMAEYRKNKQGQTGEKKS